MKQKSSNSVSFKKESTHFGISGMKVLSAMFVLLTASSIMGGLVGRQFVKNRRRFFFFSEPSFLSISFLALLLSSGIMVPTPTDCALSC